VSDERTDPESVSVPREVTTESTDEADDVATLSIGPTTDEWVGTVLEGLRIDRVIARSSNSRVYLARRLTDEKRYAVKMLRKTASPRSVKRLEREARALAELDHPNIVRVVHYGMTPADEAFLVTEYFEGRTVFEHVRDRGPLPAASAIAVCREVAAGLAHAHERGIVHRDLKPGNILLVEGGVKILDFGIAKLIEIDPDISQLTHPAQILGTPSYMAPEQILAPRDATEKSDMYGLGAVLVRMATGAAPYRGDRASVVEQHLSAPPPDIAGPVGLIVRRLMAKDPAERPTARALVELIDAQAPVSVPSVTTRTSVPAERERSARLLAVILMVAAAFLLGLYISTRRDWPIVP
jgi:serine/threonine-protein kinase